jgi:hypothetical protein
MRRGARRGQRLHGSMCTPAPGTGTQDGAERLKNLVMLVMLKKRTSYLSTSSPKSLESSEITARWCSKIWASILTTFPSAKKETFSTWCPVQGVVLRSLRQLAMSMQGAVPIWPLGGRSRFCHSEVATMHRNGDKPGKIPTSTMTPNRPCGRCRGGAINHGDHGDHCLKPSGGLHLAPEEKPDALFHEEKAGVVVSS